MCGGKRAPVPLLQRPDDQLKAIAKPVEPVARPMTNRGRTITPTGQNPRLVAQYNKDLDIYNQAQGELQRRQQVTDQLAAQRAEKENILKTQQQQFLDAQKQQAELQVQQQAQAAQLQAQQTERLAGIRTAGSAVTQSLQILGKQPGKQAPTAAAAAPAGKKAVSRMAPSSGLRIGSTKTGSGAGANVAI